MNVDIFKRYLRQLKLELITKELEWIEPKISFFDRFKIGYSLLKSLKNDGILVGSRALNCYCLDNKRIFERRFYDWDFIVDELTFFKIAEEYNIDTFQKYGEFMVIDIQKGLRVLTDEYELENESGINPFGLEFHIILKNENIPFHKINGWKIGKFNYLLEEKIKLSRYSEENIFKNIKHCEDIDKIIIKLKSKGFFENVN